MPTIPILNDSTMNTPLDAMSLATTEPESAGIQDGSGDDRTAPSTPPHPPSIRGSSPASSRQLEVSSGQTWPQDLEIPPTSPSRPPWIDEPDDLLKGPDDFGLAASPDATPDPLILGPGDAIKANDFSSTDNFLPPKIQPSGSIVSDAGNQRYKKLNHPDAAQHYDREPRGVPEFQSFLSVFNTSQHWQVHPQRSFTLQRALRDACEKVRNPMNDGNQTEILPKKKLDSIINMKLVALELSEYSGISHTHTDVRKTAKAVCEERLVTLPGGKERLRSYRAVFAILVFLERSGDIHLFLNERVSDLDLPLARFDDPSDREGHLSRRDSNGKPLKCFKGWSPAFRDSFFKYQWMMLAPFFSLSEYNHVYHYPLSEHHILPFIEEEKRHSSKSTVNSFNKELDVEGGFSQVFIVWMHPDHHNFHHCELSPKRGFAIKQLKKKDREHFENEVEMLKKFTGDGAHRHVVSVLATYEQFDRYHLIFHRAEGNLFDYWKKYSPNPAFDYNTVTWVARQLRGLADGLLRFHRHYTFSIGAPESKNVLEHERAEMHLNDCVQLQQGPEQISPNKRNQERRYGRHGDLKPENILWFHDNKEPKGVLKITDFGEAKLHTKETRTYRESRGIDTLTYRPPECDIHPYTIRQSSDIWSLGCIFLEFVTWTFGGSKYLEEFTQKRLVRDHDLPRFKSDSFYERIPVLGKKGARRKPAITNQIEELKENPLCTEYFREVLCLIDYMLVVEPSKIFSGQGRRKTCAEVESTLAKAYNQCLENRIYAVGK